MSLRRIYMWIGLVIIIIILGLSVATSWYTVDESEQAVVITLGEAEETNTEPGLHFKLPWPIQTVETLSQETFSLDFGYYPDSEEDADVIRMITGDENIVLADLVVQWRIIEPEKYLFNSTDPKGVLENATSASLRGIIGTSEIDEALTSGKAEIENDVRDLLTKLISDYDIGISILDVKLQEVDLPNQEVRKAFTKVTDARETMNTKINEAKKYENQQVEEALGEKDAIISRAEGDKVERIEKARGDISQFNALYEEYADSPDVTRDRLVIETLEDVLPNAQVYILNEDGNTLQYLPLTNQANTQTIRPGESESSQNTDEAEGSNKNE
ncbi:FtsH protease activity modulator HflK [Virgibacillus sp. MSP4-1]|uniref:FtsH protease activity modulator HflK n=1 Tax=Virgibacillus sp. MSP4-1 TaxID=2700081 RepID=UPI0003A85B9B|nr:FtsH protease activity modulator HflK [Virgibacillus sp. MSP4-1]QHS22986.1 FtsH protease activity modulator HflK [Virgibacillus sp. MSP4-1]